VPVSAAPTVAFAWVPFPVIATSTASVGFTADAAAVRVLCSLDGAAATICTGNSVSYSGLADGPHTVALWAENEAGVSSDQLSTSFTVDSTGATVSWTSTPPPRVASDSVTLGFSASDLTVAPWCSVDGAAASVCGSPLTLTGLADGAHAVSVYTVDAVGNVGAAIQTTFTVDTTGPAASLTSAPPATITANTASVAFTVDDPTATAWCSLDGALPATCTSPVSYDSLADGPHTLAIYAIDAVGNQGPTRTANFMVSTTAPTVTLNSVPSPLSNSTTAAVAFSLDDPTATAWCSLDGALSTPCTSAVSYSGLGDGPHTIDVYATSLGSQQSATASTAFTVDTQAPVLSISHAPMGTVTSANAQLTYTVNDPSATVWCSIDGGAATACTNPVNLGGLPAGPHTVALHATDPAGNSSSTTGASFTIDNTGPTVSFTVTPPATSASRTGTASFTADDPAAATWCSLDGNAAQACSGSVSYNNLSNGSHSIGVYAIDAAGNRGATSTITFSVLAAAPTLLTTPPALSLFSMVNFSWIANPGLNYQYSYDGVTWHNTPSHSSYSARLNFGTYTFRLRGVDSRGAVTAVTSFTFRVI
jgi:predicted phage tail protein